jgi:hypothetical protein
MALYVPLDVGFADDDKLIIAGPMAELLYLRSLAFVKRAETNGHIRPVHLPIISARIPRPRLQVDRLLEVGAWCANGDGWYIAAWLKRNLPAEEITKARREAGVIGNHYRWHVSEHGKPSPTCPLCNPS